MNRLTKGAALFGRIAIGSGGLKLGSGATLKAINYGTLSAVHGTVLPGGIGTITTAFAGLAAADMVLANPLAPTAGLVLNNVKPAAGTLTAYLTNPTSGTVQPGTFTMTYAQFDLT